MKDNMNSSSLVSRLSPAVATLLVIGTATPAAAAGPSWWQRIEGYAVLGTASVKATPDTGGSITASFDDSDTGATDKELLIEGGRASKDYLASGSLGARFRQTENFTWGLELEGFSFSDAVATTPRDRPGTTPLQNFATYREESLFRMDGSDISATAGYSRWGATAEGQVGWGNGSYRTRSEMFAFGVFTTGNFVNLNLSNGTTFKGDGLVYGLRLAYDVPRAPVSLFVRYKHSKLEGETDAFGSAVGSIASSPSAPLVGAATVTRNAAATTRRDDIEAGLQYDFALAAGIGSFIRASYALSDLRIRGLPTGGAGFGGTINDLTTSSFVAAGMRADPGSTVGKAAGKLEGIRFAVGVEF